MSSVGDPRRSIGKSWGKLELVEPLVHYYVGRGGLVSAGIPYTSRSFDLEGAIVQFYEVFDFGFDFLSWV